MGRSYTGYIDSLAMKEKMGRSYAGYIDNPFVSLLFSLIHFIIVSIFLTARILTL